MRAILLNVLICFILINGCSTIPIECEDKIIENRTGHEFIGHKIRCT